MGAEATKHSVGWLCGVLVFWALTAWLVVVGLSSIIPQIFWPAHAQSVAFAGCLPDLRDLQRELLAYAANSVENATQSRAAEARTVWFREFDERLKNTGAHCAVSEQPAFDELMRVRHSLEAFIERFEREEAPRVQKLEQLLADDMHSVSP